VLQNWVRVTLKQVVNGALAISDWDYRTESTPTSAALFALLSQMDGAAWLDVVNALQHQGVSNVSFNATWRGNAAVTADLLLSGGGGETVDPIFVPQSQMCFYIRKYVGESFSWSDGTTEETTRPIQGGALFLTGVTDS